MFTYLNKLITKPNKNYARSAPTMTMNTIYEQATYKVFAVMVVQQRRRRRRALPLSAHRFHRRQRFPPFRRRDPRPVGLRLRRVDGCGADDELLMLSTCNGTSQVHFDDGRTVVIARKVAPG